MSDYRRMVSYFYRYGNEKRQENVGYARIESRNDRLKLTISMRDNKVSNPQEFDVYFYIQKKESIKGIYIGKEYFRNGRFEFLYSCAVNDIADSGYSLDDFNGMLVYYDKQLFYGSQWDEIPICMKNWDVDQTKHSAIRKEEEKDSGTIKLPRKNIYGDVVEDGHMQSAVKEQKIEKDKQSIENEKSMESKILQNEEVKEGKDKKEKTEKGKECNDDRKQSKIEKMTDEQLNREIKKKINELWGGKVKENSKEETLKIQEECEKNLQRKEDCQKDEKLKGIAYLLKYRSPLPDFSNHEVMQCVRIMPEDIGLMHRSNWEYGNNSFLMHGYYNYRYLLLGCMCYEDQKKQYIIGVPGIFSNKDKYLAEIFGFHKFIPIRSCPFKTGEFGYWIGKLHP